MLQVNAFDRDQGENADFLYLISSEMPEGAFLIDPRTGWITVRDQEMLDREVRTKIRLTIQAVEKVEPYGRKNQKPSSVEIEITLLDANGIHLGFSIFIFIFIFRINGICFELF